MSFCKKALAGCVSLLVCVGLVACGGSKGGGTDTGSTVGTPSVVGDFTLAATPASLTLSPGGEGQQVSVTATPSGGFTGMVTVDLSGLPPGVTAQPAMLSLTPGTAQSVTLTAGAGVAAGASTVVINGVSSTLSHTTSVAVTVAAATNPPGADFSLAVMPGSLTLVSGGATQQISVNAVPTNSFAGAVSVAISGLPTGVTAEPATLSLTPGTAQHVTLVAAPGVAAGAATLTLTGTSGALSHSATVALTIAGPQPDYTLTLSPTPLTLVAGGAGMAVNLTANGVNAFSGTVAITITGLPSGVTANPTTLTLAPGVTQSTTLTAALTAAQSSSTVVFAGTSAGLDHSVTLELTVQAAATTAAPDVTTYHYDVARDGLNAKETILTLTNVNSTLFGKIGFDTVDGKVDAEPLYLANVPIGGQLHNVLYVATEHGSVYAFDADSGVQLWQVSVIGNGETPSDDHGCGQISPEIGITSTPVIDRAQGPNGTLFAVGMSKDGGGSYHQRLHALDVTTGAEISGSPTEITASYPGLGDNTQNGIVVFDPSQYAERAALLLANGAIYMGWTSHCDNGLYTGWVMGYSESTLQQTQVLNVTPNGQEGSIWMSGDGLAADSSGNIYLLDANGTFDTTFDTNGFPAKGDYGNAMLKLSTNGQLAVADYFEMYNTKTESNGDLDLGSGGELLLPDQTDAHGDVQHLIVGAGKDQNIYLANRDNMGKFNPASNPQDSNLYQQINGQLGGTVFSTPAYFNGTIYYGPVSASLKAFSLVNAQLGTTPSSQSANTFPYPGTSPGISANGTQNGIVWTLESGLGSRGVLHAYDASDLSHELYNTGQATGGRDAFGNGNKFITPMIVNGKVYVGTQTGVAVFGLLP
ncbi:PQQ-like beta-propeller repeat protein [Granulicella sp. S190]|uniref:PQQ-like beta-propeller repeat protein n=1 Tax=Granulicella sp. S190 TaxID=1747226 RepID=UPI0020B11CB6|nr:PQQ-like beta-propeller repeat protein [Granulicella sp. S190]